MSLRYGAFDFLLRGGVPVFLEVNPDGDWQWAERRARTNAVTLGAAQMLAGLHRQALPAGHDARPFDLMAFLAGNSLKTFSSERPVVSPPGQALWPTGRSSRAGAGRGCWASARDRGGGTGSPAGWLGTRHSRGGRDPALLIAEEPEHFQCVRDHGQVTVERNVPASGDLPDHPANRLGGRCQAAA
jgi:hypothetical protein